MRFLWSSPLEIEKIAGFQPPSKNPANKTKTRLSGKGAMLWHEQIAVQGEKQWG
jgi:hypothetical protein